MQGHSYDARVVWRHTWTGHVRHAVPASTVAADSAGPKFAMAVCGVMPAWHDPTGWRDTKQDMPACRRCERTLGLR